MRRPTDQHINLSPNGYFRRAMSLRARPVAFGMPSGSTVHHRHLLLFSARGYFLIRVRGKLKQMTRATALAGLRILLSAIAGWNFLAASCPVTRDVSSRPVSPPLSLHNPPKSHYARSSGGKRNPRAESSQGTIHQDVTRGRRNLALLFSHLCFLLLPGVTREARAVVTACLQRLF